MSIKRIAISMVAAALALGVSLPVTASAAGNGGLVEIQPRLTTPKQVRHPAEGGTWTYGNYGDMKIHSDYEHPSANHASSCKLDGTFNESICTAPGYTSYSQVPCPIDHPWTVDEYWYKLC